ncbi:MAG: P-II family nitrogen regulator [Planctomycetota bacterium]|jgi:nitrogen regulatory protein P-II 1
MKLIIAYIQPHKLEDVKKALAEADVGKMSVTNSLGCGAQMGYEESYRGIKSIIQSARTGEIGDGKIFVLELSDCIRIRTGEHGKEAIG